MKDVLEGKELAAALISGVLGGGAITEVLRRVLPSRDKALEKEEEFTRNLMGQVHELAATVINGEVAYRKALREVQQDGEIRLGYLRKEYEDRLAYWEARCKGLQQEVDDLRNDSTT